MKKTLTLTCNLLFFFFIIGINKISAQITAASVTTDSINSVTATSATVYGNVTNSGNDSNVVGGICYSTAINPTKANDTVSNYSYGLGSFNASISGLKPNNTYYVRAYATNAAGTAYGGQLQFTTGTATLPIVTSDSVNTVTATTADAYGTITNNGNDADVKGGFCYSKSSNPTIADGISGYNNGPGVFATIDSLTPATTYYVRAYTTNIAGTAYGSQLQFTTGTATLATITTDSINTITTSSATVYGNITNTGNDPDLTGGVCYSTSPNPTIADSSASSFTTGIGSFTTYIYNLSPNTTYYVKAYTTNAAGTVYGSQLQFTTDSATLASVTTDSINTVSLTTATAYLTITNTGGDPNVKGGICYSTSPNPTIAHSILGSYYNDSAMYANLDSLTPGTTYYVRAYATDAAGTAYGSQLQFTTLGINVVKPLVTTDSINNITTTSATVFGSLTLPASDTAGNGNYLGFCQSTSPNPTFPNDTVVNTKNDSTIFISSTQSQLFYFSYYGTMYNLVPNTTYYVRAVMATSAGISYGSQLQFTTGEGDCFANYTTTYDTTQNTFTLTVDPRTSAIAKSYLWNFGDGTTSTNPAPSHTYTTNGIYNVCMKITVASGDSCTYCHSIGKDSLGNIYRTAGFSMTVVNRVVTDVSGIDATNNYSVFPNPATDGKSTVIFGNPVTNATINVISVTGVKVLEMTNYTGSQIPLDISNQAAGVYIIEVTSNGEVYRAKLIKQ